MEHTNELKVQGGRSNIFYEEETTIFESGHRQSDAEESQGLETTDSTTTKYTSPEPFKEDQIQNYAQNLEIRYRSDQTTSYQTSNQPTPIVLPEINNIRYPMNIVNEQEYYADDEETNTETEDENSVYQPRKFTVNEINYMRNEIRFTFYNLPKVLQNSMNKELLFCPWFPFRTK
ncbi:uncharacterized protein GO595_004049 [Histomonas meleagridis]|uniref:uncharacterized protein n=1 Tax=Histomonas meleagridis TaxID=135588 RepID=UPI00355A6EBE|nr:hypothetical protein GO595_004049 [Histomonas meleagridis]